jgi:hypothetical protein
MASEQYPLATFRRFLNTAERLFWLAHVLLTQVNCWARRTGNDSNVKVEAGPISTFDETLYIPPDFVDYLSPEGFLGTLLGDSVGRSHPDPRCHDEFELG